MTDNYEPHENPDDFNEHELGAENHQQKRSMGGNIAEAWRTRPGLKFMVLVFAIVAVLIAGFSFLGGGTSGNEFAHFGRPPQLNEPPGGTVSPYMRQQTELASKERAEQAIASGGSAIQTPIGQTTNVDNFGGTENKNESLNELRAETEQLKQQVQQQQTQQQQVQQQIQQQQRPPEQFDDSLAQAMQNQMKQLLDSWKPKGITDVKVIGASELKDEEKSAPNQAAVSTANNGAVLNSSAVTDAKIIVNAGTVSYAQLLTEANSDVPGPILAQIVSGPLAGARAIGGFQVSDGYEKYLVLKFSIADRKGMDYSINAVALDPNTTLGGMATEVDERYFVRVVLPAAAGFLQGMGQALGQGNSSVSTSGDTTVTTIASNGYRQGIYNGLGQAAQTMGEFFQNQANVTKPLVRVAAGTPIGMFFVQPVTQPTTPAGYAPLPQQASVNGGFNPMAGGANTSMFGGNGFNNTGNYPGATVPGYGAGSNGAPYPNYAMPGYGYGGSTINRGFTTMSGSGMSPYSQNYGQ